MRLVLPILLLVARVAGAQGYAALEPGERVRVMIPEARAQQETATLHRFSFRGNVSRIQADTIFLHVPGTTGEVGVPFALVRGVYRSRGVPSRPVSGLRQAFGAAAIGALYAGLTYGLDENRSATNRREAIALGAGFGAGVGFLHGLIFPTERWRRVRP